MSVGHSFCYSHPVKQANGSRSKGVAYHESGHAVVACLSGIPFRYVTITSPFDGHIQLKDQPPWADEAPRLAAEREVMVSFAGQVAEQKHLGKGTRRPALKGPVSGDDADVRKISRVFGGHRPATILAWCQWLYLRTKETVDEHWPEIEAVASALLKRGRLSESEVKAILSATATKRIPQLSPNNPSRSVRKQMNASA